MGEVVLFWGVGGVNIGVMIGGRGLWGFVGVIMGVVVLFWSYDWGWGIMGVLRSLLWGKWWC